MCVQRNRTRPGVGDRHRGFPGLIIDLPDHMNGARAGILNAVGQRHDKRLEGSARRIVHRGDRTARGREAVASQPVRFLPGFVAALPQHPCRSSCVDEEHFQRLAGRMVDGREVRADRNRTAARIGNRHRRIPGLVVDLPDHVHGAVAGIVRRVARSDDERLERSPGRVISRRDRAARRHEPVPRQRVRRLPRLVAALPYNLDGLVVVGGEDLERLARWVMHRGCRQGAPGASPSCVIHGA